MFFSADDADGASLESMMDTWGGSHQLVPRVGDSKGLTEWKLKYKVTDFKAGSANVNDDWCLGSVEDVFDVNSDDASTFSFQNLVYQFKKSNPDYKIGTWLGPNNVSQSIRKLVALQNQSAEDFPQLDCVVCMDSSPPPDTVLYQCGHRCVHLRCVESARLRKVLRAAPTAADRSEKAQLPQLHPFGLPTHPLPPPGPRVLLFHLDWR